jgi:hypothetical protein
VAACAHDKPFENDDFGVDSTLTRGTNRQLTYNLATDLTPAWRPDGSGIVYMFEEPGRNDHDRCLGTLPGTGGTLRDIICPASLPSLDSTDALYEPAIASDGKMLYVREASPIGLVTPIQAALVLASPESPLEPTVIRTYPYTATNGKIHQGIAYINWLSATRAVYLAQRVLYIAACGTCPMDTVRTGIEVVGVDLSGSTPAFQIIPNTDEVSSISAGTDEDAIFFTRNGDSRVYQMTLSTGNVAVVHDFGANEVARDAHVAGNRLFAVLKGRVSYTVDSVLGPLQTDAGGQIRMVDLTNGSESILTVNGRFFRRPVPSPVGNRMVAEGYIATIVGTPAFPDTSIAKAADLWLFEVP